jgi:hypothetical protein
MDTGVGPEEIDGVAEPGETKMSMTGAGGTDMNTTITAENLSFVSNGKPMIKVRLLTLQSRQRFPFVSSSVV